MEIAELVIIPRPPEAVAYHVYEYSRDSLTAPPKLVHNTRGYDTVEGPCGRTWAGGALSDGERVSGD